MAYKNYVPMLKKGGEWHPLHIIDIEDSEEEEMNAVVADHVEEDVVVADQVEKVMILYGIVLYCIILYYTVPYCTILYCTVLYSTGGGEEEVVGVESGGLHHHPPPKLECNEWPDRRADEESCSEDYFLLLQVIV